MAEPLSTIGITFKMGDTASALAEVEDLVNYPDMLGTPEQIDVSNTKVTSRRYIPGIKDPGEMPFEFLFSGMKSGTNYHKLKAAQDAKTSKFFSLTFPDGSGFSWQGRVALSLAGKGISEAVTFNANIFPTSEFDDIIPV